MSAGTMPSKAAGTELGLFGPRFPIDRDELEDARWFSRDECRALLDGTHPQGLKCPPPMAIAHHILRAWVIDAE